LISRSTPLIVAAVAIVALSAGRATGQWVDGGLPVCEVPGGKFGVKVAPDGLGGAFLTWTAITPDDPQDSNIFAQHIRSDGTLDPLWPADGLPVCTAGGAQYVGEIIPDGEGGAFIAWGDRRSPPPDSSRLSDVYLQRLRPGGSLAVGWPGNGIPVCSGGCTEQSPKLAPDGGGGVFVAWQRDTLIAPSYVGPGGFRASRVTGSGVLASAWPPEGIPVASSPTRQRLRMILPDGSGGFYAVSDGDLGHTYCHRVTSGGNPAIGWPPDGLEVSPATSFGPSAALDGEGGLFFSWSSFTAQGDPYAGVYALRLRSDGSPAAGWPAAGLRVSLTEANAPLVSVATSDSGAVVLWVHFENGVVSAHAQKITSTGSVAAGWPNEGVQTTQGDRYLQGLVGASDGTGGLYFAWEFYESAPLGVPPPTGVIAQHLKINGVPAPGWPSEGLYVSASTFQANEPAMIPVPGKAAVMAWEGYSSGPGNKIVAQKLVESGAESFALLLTRADATPNRVSLAWRASPPADAAVTIYRREEVGPWQVLGVARPDLTGLVTFEDMNATAGHGYSYRVSIAAGSEVHFYGDAAVQVPAFALAVRLASPNPVRGELSAEVELPSSAVAWIEVIDVQGRVIERKEVGGSGPSIFRVPIASDKHLASGVYFIRLTQGGKTATRQAVLIH